MQRIGVIGAGTMGHGIAQVCAMAGCDVVRTDTDEARLSQGLASVRDHLDKGITKGKVTPEVRDQALARLRAGSLAETARGQDMVIEAVPERLELKQALFLEVETTAPKETVFGTNTSSLSVTKIGSALKD